MLHGLGIESTVLLLHQTLQLKSYIRLIFEAIGSKTALSHVQSTPHTLFVQSFFVRRV